MQDDEQDYASEEAPRRGPGVIAFALPVITAGVAAVAGLVVGAVATWAFTPTPDPIIEQVPRDLTAAELALACAPLTEKAQNDLEEAEERVVGLQARVTDKEKEVADLEAEMKRRGARGAEMAKQLEAAKKELESLQTRLDRAIEEKEQLTIELTETKVQLADQKVRTHEAREDALDYKWRDFIGSAQLEICERGNRKKMGACRETVQAQLDPAIKDKFSHCVRSGQALPVVRELAKGEELPLFSALINEEEKITKGWYVLMCDPTLPESADWREGAVPLPSTGAKSATPDLDFDLDD